MFDKNNLTQEQKEAIIKQSLNPDEGRTASTGMYTNDGIVWWSKTGWPHPHIDYSELARRLLQVDELPQGALAKYKRNNQEENS